MPEPLWPILKNHLERAFGSSLSLFNNSSRDIVDFNIDAWVVNGKGTGIWLYSPDDMSAFFRFAMRNQLLPLAMLGIQGGFD